MKNPGDGAGLHPHPLKQSRRAAAASEVLPDLPGLLKSVGFSADIVPVFEVLYVHACFAGMAMSAALRHLPMPR
ncbi:hypothetical protein D3870_20155 [Noviherbaspirillum cavernae]|uniref:Uncharacterized protein n=1 Tax=Noviherbaspirillum cavernae TaxID=2320862 RepID=A0A418WVH1_9BURK|nr:hypothetical protein [Noviherbaspirillum cavernae]RJF96722.1 hypothetical protein D3870_20155 [Noviherbaspirillum cavernae]